MLHEPKHKKHVENYSKAHHNQIALNQLKKENLKSSQKKRGTLQTQEQR